MKGKNRLFLRRRGREGGGRGGGGGGQIVRGDEGFKIQLWKQFCLLAPRTATFAEVKSLILTYIKGPHWLLGKFATEVITKQMY